MYKYTLQIFKKIVGVTLIIIGIISGFIPLVQGWIFILVGLLLIGVEKETIKKWLGKIKKLFSR